MASFSHPRCSFTVKQKLAVLAEFQASGNLKLVARTHKISLHYWISKKYLLKEVATAEEETALWRDNCAIGEVREGVDRGRER